MFDSAIPKNRQLAIVLAFASMMTPIAGFHKFYLGQPLWGLVYLVLSWTPIPHVAAAIEAVWYLTQDDTHFGINSTLQLPERAIGAQSAIVPTHPVATISTSIRELDQLRTDGLISEYEFEQKRRQWLDRA
jgi:TM2 domain-containing membrane protein YozV